MHDRENNESSKAAFMEHLERSSKIVSSWPRWKQSLLGGKVQEKKCSSTEHGINSRQKDHK